MCLFTWKNIYNSIGFLRKINARKVTNKVKQENFFLVIDKWL